MRCTEGEEMFARPSDAGNTYTPTRMRSARDPLYLHHGLPAADQASSSSASISMWPVGSTFRQTPRTTPLSSMRNVLRSIPVTDWP